MSKTISELAKDVVEIATAKSVTISTAESCTGGGIGEALTRIAGASRVFTGGMIAYDNDVKERALGVPKPLLISHGAVSEPVAKSMAENAREIFAADYAVAVTGIAGPGGGTDTKPVGLVFIALASDDETVVFEMTYGSISRDLVREKTIASALTLLHQTIIKT